MTHVEKNKLERIIENIDVSKMKQNKNLVRCFINLKGVQIKKKKDNKNTKPTQPQQSVEKQNANKLLIPSFEIVNNIIWYWSNSLQCSTFHLETRFGALGFALGADNLSLGLSLSLQFIIMDLPQFEFLGASGGHNMLHSNMNPLSQDLVPHLQIVHPITNLNNIEKV